MNFRNIFIWLSLFCSIALSAQDLREQLSRIPQVQQITPMESSIFGEKYLILFEQPLDHDNPSLGSFTQRVWVNHIHNDSLTTLVTEGYGAQYAMSPRNRDEISRLLNTNQVVVEHRYFLESTPNPINWDYLTVYNSACDLHNITSALKSIYDEKWISTGISKGGQTTLAYRTYFPDDIDVSVPYVAPLCKGLDEKRHEVFLMDFVGTAEERQRIEDFQIEILKRRSSLFPLFQDVCEEKGYKFNLPLNEIYDYSVLEYPFALWQWGTPVSKVPSADATDEELFKSLMAISDPSYFVNETPIRSFFVQAARELGYYGYETKPFKKWLTIKSSKGYLNKLFQPEGVEFKFDNTHYMNAKNLIENGDVKMIFIYGEYDPWSAAIIDDPHRDNIRIFNKEKGSHSTRISSFPDQTKSEIISLLKSWLYN